MCLGVVNLLAVQDGPVGGFDLNVVQCCHIHTFGARALWINQCVIEEPHFFEFSVTVCCGEDVTRAVLVASPELKYREHLERLCIGWLLGEHRVAGSGHAVGITRLRTDAQLLVQKGRVARLRDQCNAQ